VERAGTLFISISALPPKSKGAEPPYSSRRTAHLEAEVAVENHCSCGRGGLEKTKQSPALRKGK
jgi:hypothetical protein